LLRIFFTEIFDLTDALLTTGAVLSPAHLSLAASFQRGWGSIYDALVDGRIDDQAVETLLAQYPLEGGEPIYAVDASVWARCDAEVAVEQIKELLQGYPDTAPFPIFVFDAGYEPGQLAQHWGNLPFPDPRSNVISS
jgi:hypothetical protein